MKSNERKNLTLKLKSLEKTVVNTKTKSEYLKLMRVYETGEWNFKLGGEIPTKTNYWEKFKAQTCISVENKFGFATREYYESSGEKIISLNEFYKKQRITPQKVKVIDRYF